MKLFLIKYLLSKLSEKDKHIILTDAVKDLYSSIGKEDILQEKNGEWFYQNKQVLEADKKYLISEAKTLLGMKLWKILVTDVEYQANKRMYLHSKSEIDLIAGKLALYNLDVLKTRLNSIAKGSGSLK